MSPIGYGPASAGAAFFSLRHVEPDAPREIVPPARLGRFDTALALAVAAALTAFPFARAAGPWIALGLAAVGGIAWRRRTSVLTAAAVFAACTVGAASSEVLMTYWPTPLALAALALGALAFASRAFAPRAFAPRAPAAGVFAFLRRGRIDAGVHLTIVASALVAGVALIAWFAIAHPDYSAARRALFPDVHVALLFLGVVLFSAVNGALEEIAYRGVLLQALDAAVGPGAVALVIQAAAFGAMHYGGFPRGAVGVALATTYGVMMGLVRRRSRGLLAPWIAHVLTDVTIGAILIASR